MGKLKRKESMLLATFGPALGDYFDCLIVTMRGLLSHTARSVTLFCNASTRFAILEGTAHPWRLAFIMIA